MHIKHIFLPFIIVVVVVNNYFEGMLFQIDDKAIGLVRDKNGSVDEDGSVSCESTEKHQERKLSRGRSARVNQ